MSSNTWSNYSYFPIQAHMLVCRALSNMLLLPWPNLPESEQQWQTRSSNHASLLAALTREYKGIRGTVNITPRQPDLDNSQYFFLILLWRCPFFHTLSFFVLLYLCFLTIYSTLYSTLLQWKQWYSRPCLCSETSWTASLGNPPNHVRSVTRVFRSLSKCPSAFSQFLYNSQVSVSMQFTSRVCVKYLITVWRW